MKREISGVNYTSSVTPADYKCDDCGVTGIKLWREYQNFVSQTRLLCAVCAEADQKKSHKLGWQSSFSLGEGDQIGWYIPAVPVEGENAYWGYTSVPQAGVEWWKGLPDKQPLEYRKVKALMQVIEKLIGRHNVGLVVLDEPTFELFEFAKRIRWVKNEKELQVVLTDLANFKK